MICTGCLLTLVGSPCTGCILFTFLSITGLITREVTESPPNMHQRFLLLILAAFAIVLTICAPAVGARKSVSVWMCLERCADQTPAEIAANLAQIAAHTDVITDVSFEVRLGEGEEGERGASS